MSAQSPTGTGPAGVCTPVRRGVCVGVLTPLTGGLFWGEIIAGVVQAVAEAGGSVIVVQTLDAGQTVNTYQSSFGTADPLGWDHIDGFVALLRATDDEYLRRTRATGKPVVFSVDSGTLYDPMVATMRRCSGVSGSCATT